MGNKHIKFQNICPKGCEHNKAQRLGKHNKGKVREGFLEEVIPELNLEGKRNCYAKTHVCNSTVGCFPGGSAGKESACNAGDLGLIPGLGKSPREGNSYPL